MKITREENEKKWQHKATENHDDETRITRREGWDEKSEQRAAGIQSKDGGWQMRRPSKRLRHS
eukprot:763842-Hanusia_phi.AAC.4